MQNNSSKLKTFLITFLIMSVLIAAGYFIFKKAGGDATKGDSVSKTFTSLFGSSKQKVVDMVTSVTSKPSPVTPSDTNSDENNKNPNDTNNSGSSSGSNSKQSGINNLGGTTNTQNIGDPNVNLGNNLLSPSLNPFPYIGGSYNMGGYTSGTYIGWGIGTGTTIWTRGTNPGSGLEPSTKMQCEDGKDNDGDGKIDRLDPGCHYDLDASNTSSYDPVFYSESAENSPTTPVTPGTGGGKCSNADIVLTNEAPNYDRTRMEELLRDFYRIAPNLATKEDIVIEKGNAKTYKETIDNASLYTKQCYAERDANNPSKSLVNGGRYLLEVRKSPLFEGSTITPSDTFLPGDKGVKFEVPVVSPNDSIRRFLFSKASRDPNNPNDIKMSWYIQQADGGLGSKVIVSHVLQGLRDVGITKYYLPDNTYSQANYDRVLLILRTESSRYMSTLKQARDGWANRSNAASALSDWGEPWMNDKGNAITKELFDIYLASGATDDLRRVYPQLYPDNYDGEFNIQNVNFYKKFEDQYQIW